MPRIPLLLAGLLFILLLAPVSLLSSAGIGAQAAPGPTPTHVPLIDPVMGEFDPALVADVDLSALPVIPEIGEQAKLIYLDGLERGNNPHTFAKVGDCMTDDPNFLYPLGEGNYDLGDYASLQTVLDTFTDGDVNSFARKSQAAAGGFNTSSLLDSMWANPEFCQAGETPLSCEFNVMKPSVALIMFGTNDAYYLNEAQFDFFLRSILVETIRNGTLPILSTFPIRPEFPEKSALYNQIVAQAAQDYDVPLINLWRALDPLPDHGVDPVETTHMTAPEDGSAADFTAENLQTGFTVRNLVTLQTLDAVLQAVGGE
jgi:hypothetical protein